MRITKKFTGDSCIGKRVFIAQELHAGNIVAIQQAQSELRMLRQMWIERLLGNIIVIFTIIIFIITITRNGTRKC
jgi:hypothetical protein